MPTNAETPCVVPDCPNTVLAKGLCSIHYDRMRRTGKLERTRPAGRQACSICGETVVGFGLCELHYRRRHLMIEPKNQRKDRPERECKGCDKTIDPAARLGTKFCSQDCKTAFFNAIATQTIRDDPEAAAKAAAYNYNYQLGRRYGLTAEDVAAILDRQGGGCAICGLIPTGKGRKGIKFGVEHDHVSGEVRGIACTRCNAAMGGLNDDPSLAARALLHLARTPEAARALLDVACSRSRPNAP